MRLAASLNIRPLYPYGNTVTKEYPGNYFEREVAVNEIN
jgi:hypothetical protein